MGEELGDVIQLLEFAVRKEAEAYQFYTAWSHRMHRPEMQAVFNAFAEEELEHKAKLELELMKRGKVVKLEDTVGAFEDNDSETEGFRIGPGFDMDYKSMLLMAINKEEAAFKRYVDLAGVVDDEESREILFELAEEEMKHKIRFETEYNNMLKTK